MAATLENSLVLLTLTGKQSFRYAIETSTALSATKDAQRFYRPLW